MLLLVVAAALLLGVVASPALLDTLRASRLGLHDAPPPPASSDGGERRADVATRLLRQALDHCWCAPEELAAALGVQRRDLTHFGSWRRRLTPDDRLRLAGFLEGVAPASYLESVRFVRTEALIDLERAAAEAARRAERRAGRTLRRAVRARAAARA
jgi:plasmid maintenance system antidote protein VapI